MERELLLMFDEFLLTFKKPVVTTFNNNIPKPPINEKDEFFKILLTPDVCISILYYRYTFISIFYKFFNVPKNIPVHPNDKLYWEQAVRTHLFECNKLKKALKSPLSFWFFSEEPAWFFDLQEISVAQDGRLIDSMPKVYEKLNLIAVNNPFALQYIKNPSQRVILKAIKKNGQVIKFLKEATDEMFKIILEQNGTFIRFIDSPTEKQKILAIKNDISSIKFIQVQSLEFQLLFIKLLDTTKYPELIKELLNPSEYLQIAILKKDFKLIKMIKKPTQMAYDFAFKLNSEEKNPNFRWLSKKISGFSDSNWHKITKYFKSEIGPILPVFEDIVINDYLQKLIKEEETDLKQIITSLNVEIPTLKN